MLIAVFALAVAVISGGVSAAEPRSACDDLLKRFGARIVDVVCVDSPDLTTANASTTPADNSLPGLPLLAFTLQTDRAVITPDAAHKTPITRAVPGVQLQARIADDPAGEARILVRLPDVWNGRLVVAGASGTRSEFNGDFAWSDFVVQKGYAYVSQNKGMYNLFLSTPSDPLSCRLNPSSSLWVHFYANDPATPFTRWREFMVEAAQLGRDAVKARYGHDPRFTYAVGTSNGGYQVRRAIETAPELFDGGVDWEGTFIDPVAQNILTDLPPAVLNFPDYVASGFNPDSTAARNIRAAGYPPDIVANGQSMWGRYSAQFWEVTLCQWQKRLDPTYDTYGSGTGNYNYVARLSASNVGQNVAAIETTGRIQRPLITVAGTMDALLPIDHHARAYARSVALAQSSQHDGDHEPAYRLYEVQNGNHIETFNETFPQLRLIEPHAQRAFELLVNHVEQRAQLPPDQCIPPGGVLESVPAQAGHCASLFVP